ncbi:MAG: NUDIX domain-containing protein [Candidatus Nanohaloarchaea archaeon]|nr:NUDIX domain-containing protein [Candidatus Nanohaloarchaea archaeon]
MGRLPAGADRDFTAGCLVVEDGELLLMHHSKLGLWLQPGGHVEEDETPDETAKRETREETGIVPRFHPSTQPDSAPGESYNLPEPFQVNLHRIRDGHWHCSFLYLATVAEERDATHPEEHDGLRWFSPTDLASDTDDMPANLRQAGQAAIETITAAEQR